MAFDGDGGGAVGNQESAKKSRSPECSLYTVSYRYDGNLSPFFIIALATSENGKVDKDLHE